MSDQSSFADRPPATPEAPVHAPPPRPASLATHIVTPEAVALEIDVAGPGSRIIEAIIDLAIQFAIIFVIGMIMTQTWPDSTAASVVFLVVSFLVLWGYYPLLEGLWNGQTIGKRVCQLRAVMKDGQPMTIGPVLVRNLIRIPEEFIFPFVALISMIVSAKAQRLGDLAGGTIVIRERPMPAPVALRTAP